MSMLHTESGPLRSRDPRVALRRADLLAELKLGMRTLTAQQFTAVLVFDH